MPRTKPLLRSLSGLSIRRVFCRGTGSSVSPCADWLVSPSRLASTSWLLRCGTRSSGLRPFFLSLPLSSLPTLLPDPAPQAAGADVLPLPPPLPLLLREALPRAGHSDSSTLARGSPSPPAAALRPPTRLRSFFLPLAWVAGSASAAAPPPPTLAGVASRGSLQESPPYLERGFICGSSQTCSSSSYSLLSQILAISFEERIWCATCSGAKPGPRPRVFRAVGGS